MKRIAFLACLITLFLTAHGQYYGPHDPADCPGSQQCGSCRGSGMYYMITGSQPCMRCGGKGYNNCTQCNSTSKLFSCALDMIVDGRYSAAKRAFERGAKLNNGGKQYYSNCCIYLGMLYAWGALSDSNNKDNARNWLREGGCTNEVINETIKKLTDPEYRKVYNIDNLKQKIRYNRMMASSIANSIANSSGFGSGSSSGSSGGGSSSNSCPICYGTGNCSICNGSGAADSYYTGGRMACSACNSTGRCSSCHGTGRR